ncbi:MAG: hypothetical protein QXS38_00220 [Candidatus Pacearchaeota archaeon]
MTTVDVSLIQSYLPILSFLLVFTVVFAILAKYKIIGESKFVNLFVSFLVATIFVSLTSAREYVVSITPWFAVFVIVSLFLLSLIGLFGKVPDILKSGIGIVVVIGLLIVFLISAYYTFSSSPFFVALGDWVSKPRVYGILLLVLSSALVSWVLIKAK